LRRGADHRVDELVLAGLGAADDLGDQVLGGLEVVRLSAVGLDDAVLERTEESERQAVLERLVAEEDVLSQELAADDVLRVSDVRRDGLAETVARGDGRAGRTEVDAQVQDALGLGGGGVDHGRGGFSAVLRASLVGSRSAHRFSSPVRFPVTFLAGDGAPWFRMRR
jgi:hypothetical protein